MFERMTLRCINLVIIFIFISLFLLIQNHAFADDMTFDLVEGLNGISLPFEETGITDAEELCQSISYCESVSYWDAQTQSFVTHEIGSSENNFILYPGYPYFVSVTQDTSWTISGDIPESVIFSLITTDGTDVNALAIPLFVNYLTTAEELANADSNVDTVWHWDDSNQGYAGHPVGTEINNFSVYAGYPYFVNITGDTTLTFEVLKCSISANPLKGGIPLEVQFSAICTGGVTPYSYSWDLDGDGTVDDTRDSFNYTYTLYGIYNVTLSVSDSVGNTSSDLEVISALSAPACVASANPANGGAPLDVDFSCTVTDTDGSIVLYEWDLDGDGVYEWSDTDTCSTAYRYETAGLYEAALLVTDNDGLTDTDSITITVGASPTADAAADPMTGPAPLEVNFTGTGADTDGSITLYEWDFNGDGTYDWSNTSSGDTAYTYNSSGIFNATLRVTDNDGLIDTDSVLISVSGPPVALPRAYPTSGEPPLTVTFFSDGEDVDGSPRYFDWDFDGDGVYDEHLLASMNTSYTYTQPGDYQATLKVTDNEGLAGTAFITISVTDPNPQGYPAATADARPTNGGAPLKVALMGSGNDPNGSIYKYEWDFEGDGVYDWEEFAQPAGQIGLLIDVGTYSSPDFVDIDGDNDFDMFIGNDDGYIYYYRNDGDAASPVWTEIGTVTDSIGSLIDVGSNSSPVFVDIDSDDDFDMFIGKSTGTIDYYRNDGDSSLPVWTYVSELTDSIGATIDVGSRSSPVFVDIDNDGDFDMFAGESGGVINYFRNDGDSSSPVWTDAGTLTDSVGSTIDIGSRSSPAFVDIDNDSDFDMFVGDSSGYVYYYRNEGNAASPVWTDAGTLTDSGGSPIDVGSYSSPVFTDIDNDGDFDMFAGNSSGNICYYRNDGDSISPVWNLASSKYSYIGVDNYSVPAFVDIDNDSDFDKFIGDGSGQIYAYRNDGDATSPVWSEIGTLTDSVGSTIDVGSRSSPAFADINNDGDFDMFVGDNSGEINYFRNDGDSSSPIWTDAGTLTDSVGSTIDVGTYSSPVFVDIDSDGDFDMFVGDNSGEINYFRNDGDSSSPIWTDAGTLTDSVGSTIDVGSYSSPAFVDIDNDGDFDMFVGENQGNIYYYRNEGDNISPLWYLVSSSYNSINVQGRSTPAFVDIDNDEDYDLFVGNSYGYIYYYPTEGYTPHTYTSPGTYNATLRVTDNDGLTDTDSVTIDIYESGSPTAMASAEPATGDAPLDVSFTGNGTDPDGTITLYEWDFDGDGAYDWNSSTSGETSYTYNNSGIFIARLRVTDNDGKTAADSVTINVTLSISTTRTDIINPIAGETGTITSTITGDDATITIKIINETGDVIKTIVSNESRPEGTYTDIWDGKDASGDIVRDGIYFFIIEYTVDDETYTYDLREEAEFLASPVDQTYSSPCNPYEEVFTEVIYSLSKPAEVSMYFWTRGPGSGEESIIHVRTVFVREPKGAGSHTELWDCVNDEDIVVDPDNEYPITLWGFELPDNTIIITGNRPEITDVSAEPNYFSTDYNPYRSDSSEYTVVSFNLSESSNVEAKIKNSEGLIVKTIDKNDLPAGANTIIWDGKDFDGNLVKAGSYTISLTAVDEDGNRSLPRYAVIVMYY